MASLGAGAEIAKADLKDAFRILPIHCEDFELLDFTLDGQYYYDMNLPMGLKNWCKLFTDFSVFLNWFMGNLFGKQMCVHYLDDWLFFWIKRSRSQS